MRLLILGPLDGHFSTAGKIALTRGAKVAHADDIDHGHERVARRPEAPISS